MNFKVHHSLHSTTLLQMFGPGSLICLHSISNVITDCLSCFPYLYIGFSFGGLIAMVIAAKIWDLPHVSMHNLHRLKCITFGQPQISMTLVEQIVDRFPEFVESVHALYLESDAFPRVMASFDRLYEQRSDPVSLPDLLHGEVTNQVCVLGKYCGLCTSYVRL